MGEVTATLHEVRVESPQAATLRLLVVAPFAYRPGQHISIDPHQFGELAAEIRERETARGRPLGAACFSLSSDALDPSFIEITVKLSSQPSVLSPYLLREARPGQTILIQGPGGKYGLPDEPPPGITGFLHLCAGSGVAPNRGMIRHALARGWPQRHVLLVQDREETDALFRPEWTDLEGRHPDRLRVRHVYSSARNYLSADRVRAVSEGFLTLPQTWAFVCGPNVPRPDGAGFVDRCKALLSLSLGFTPDRIRTE